MPRFAVPVVSFVFGLATLAGCSGSAPSPSGTDVPSSSNTAQPPDEGASGGQTPPSAGDDAGTPDPGLPSPTPSNDAGTPASDAGPPGADGGATTPPPSTTELAPYFPTWTWGSGGYPYTSLVDLGKKTGLKAVTIAFVLSGGGCVADQGIEQNLDDVKAFVAAGGHVKASFGGASGTYVESQCKDAASFAKALEDFVDATGIDDLDFDVEQDPVLTDAVNDLRGKALKLAQDAKGIRVAFTLAANAHSSGSQGGLTSQGMSVVAKAVAAGVAIHHVNLMTMDYGDSFGGNPLAPVAIGSLTDANAQLVSLVPGLTKEAAWQMLGVIPMIGKNDDAEVFSLADAKTVAAFAKTNRLGLVSFWSIDRDQVCGKGGDFNTCSTVDGANFDFTTAFKAAL